MASYDSNLQAAVDATSIAKSAGETDLATYLRAQLAERDIETTDDAWIERMVHGIETDRNFMIDSEPADYDAGR